MKFLKSHLPLWLMGTALIGGCSHPGSQVVPQSILTESGGEFSSSGVVVAEDEWWNTFGVPELDALVSKAFDQNLTIAQAWGRLNQVEASYSAAAADQIPSLSANADISDRWQESVQSGTTTDRTTGAVGVSANYELDLWGRVRAEKDAAYFDLKATEQDLNAAGMSIAAQVVESWFSLTELLLQRTLLTQQLDNAKTTQALIENRFNKGRSTQTDLLQQKQIVENRRGLLIQNQSSIEIQKSALAILLGEAPGSDLPLGESMVLPTLPPLPKTGVMAETLNARPDIQSAWLNVQALDRRVAATIANRFPRISLSLSSISSFGSPVELFETWIKSAAASLNLSIFDGGSRKAATDQRKAQLASAVLAYRSAFIGGIKEVEDALVRERQQLDYIESLESQLGFAQSVYEQTLNRYRRGDRSYLQVINAQDSLHNLARSVLSAKNNLLSNRISLYKAIGGSVELPESSAFKQATIIEL